MVAVFALPAGTSRAAVEDALADIAARHDSLRLAFSFDDRGQLRQAVHCTVVAPDDGHRASTVPPPPAQPRRLLAR